MVWCAHAHVCGMYMCVHVLMPVCRGQRRMFNLPHPALPFNKSLTELGTPPPLLFPARPAGQQDRDPPVLSLFFPQHWCCGPAWLWLCHLLCACWDPDSTLCACTTGTLPSELSPQRLKVGPDRTEVTGGNFIVFKNSLHALGFSIYISADWVLGC